VPGTIVGEPDWMICGEFEEFVRIGWATKWIHNISLFLVPVRRQDSPKALD